MKKLILSLLPLLFVSTNLTAQKIAKNEVDKFTGDKIIQSSIESMWMGSLSNPGDLRVWWSVINGIPSMSVIASREDVCSVNDKCKLYIIFSDGDKVVLNCAVNNMAKPKSLQLYHQYAVYGLAVQDIKKLQSKVMTDFRMEFTSSNLEGKIGTKRAQKVREMFKLLDVDTMLK